MSAPGKAIFVLPMLAALGLAQPPSGPRSVTTETGRFATVTRLDGSTLAGRFVSIGDDHLSISTDGEVSTVPLVDVGAVEFATDRAQPGSPGAAPAATQFFIRGGGAARGVIVRGADESVVVSFDGLPDEVAVPFDELAAVRFADPTGLEASETLFQQALADRRPAEDVLITRDATEAKAVRGVLESLSATEGSFQFGGRSRGFQLANAYAIVFAATVGSRVDPPARVTLMDGTVWPGQVAVATGTQLEFVTSLQTRLDLPLSHVRRIEFRSDRVVPLSSLAWRDENCEGVLHRPWPVRRDLSAGGTPMTLDGRRFDRGIGMHSRCEVTFDLDASYETFASWIGIDDAVRPAGNAVFRVIGDGEPLFDSGEVTGRDKASLIRVPVTGVRLLTLIVEYGQGFDLSDHANWADARLIKAAGERA